MLKTEEESINMDVDWVKINDYRCKKIKYRTGVYRGPKDNIGDLILAGFGNEVIEGVLYSVVTSKYRHDNSIESVTGFVKEIGTEHIKLIFMHSPSYRIKILEASDDEDVFDGMCERVRRNEEYFKRAIDKYFNDEYYESIEKVEE